VHLIPGRLPINGETSHDTSTTNSNRHRTADRTTTDSTTEEYGNQECSLIFIEGQGEPGEGTKNLGDRRQVRHKILSKVVRIVTILRDANPDCGSYLFFLQQSWTFLFEMQFT